MEEIIASSIAFITFAPFLLVLSPSSAVVVVEARVAIVTLMRVVTFWSIIGTVTVAVLVR